ncbi:Hemicentin-2 [Sarcoptes scabiei]|nr:Hemicentin-2 [Sarcoptes scabiei]
MMMKNGDDENLLPRELRLCSSKSEEDCTLFYLDLSSMQSMAFVLFVSLGFATIIFFYFLLAFLRFSLFPLANGVFGEMKIQFFFLIRFLFGREKNWRRKNCLIRNTPSSFRLLLSSKSYGRSIR